MEFIDATSEDLSAKLLSGNRVAEDNFESSESKKIAPAEILIAELLSECRASEVRLANIEAKHSASKALRAKPLSESRVAEGTLESIEATKNALPETLIAKLLSECRASEDRLEKIGAKRAASTTSDEDRVAENLLEEAKHVVDSSNVQISQGFLCFACLSQFKCALQAREGRTMDRSVLKQELVQLGFKEDIVDLSNMAFERQDYSVNENEFLAWLSNVGERGKLLDKASFSTRSSRSNLIVECTLCMDLDGKGKSSAPIFPTSHLPVRVEPYTVSVWVKPMSRSGLILSWGQAEKDQKGYLNSLKLEELFMIRHSSCDSDLVATFSPEEDFLLDGRWHHIAATFDGHARKIFIDFQQRAEDFPQLKSQEEVSNSDVKTVVDNIKLGNLDSEIDFGFAGQLQELCVWNVSLDIAALRESTALETIPEAFVLCLRKPLSGIWSVENDANSTYLEAEKSVGLYSWGEFFRFEIVEVPGVTQFIWKHCYKPRFDFPTEPQWFVTRPDKSLQDLVGDTILVPQTRPEVLMGMGAGRRARSRTAALIRDSCVVLVQGRYFEERLQQNKTIQERQSIDRLQLWDAQEAIELWKTFGRCFLIIISYGWLSADHPDPNNFHLYHLVIVIQRLRECFRCHVGVDDVAVALDFCSLYQGERTPEQQDSFRKGLVGFNDMYMDADVTAVKLIEMPENELRLYADRGWTTCESALIDAKPGTMNRLSFDIGTDWAARTADFLETAALGHRLPPITPSDMVAKLEERHQNAASKGFNLFTNGHDTDIVPTIYKNCFEGPVGLKSAWSLHYGSFHWGVQEIRELCKVLPLCLVVEDIDLNDNDLGDEGVEMLCEVLPSLSTLKCLEIRKNYIGQRGAHNLAVIVGNMPALEVLWLSENPFCEVDADRNSLCLAWKGAGKRADGLKFDG